MAKAQGRHQPRFGRGPAQVQRLAQPHEVLVPAQLRIHAVQRTVRWNDTVAQYLAQPDELEGGGSAFGVAGQGLLRDNVKRVPVAAPEGMRNALM